MADWPRTIKSQGKTLKFITGVRTKTEALKKAKSLRKPNILVRTKFDPSRDPKFAIYAVAVANQRDFKPWPLTTKVKGETLRLGGTFKTKAEAVKSRNQLKAGGKRKKIRVLIRIKNRKTAFKQWGVYSKIGR